MKTVFITVIVACLFIPAIAQAEYTDRKYADHACKPFANEAAIVSAAYKQGIELEELLSWVPKTGISESQRTKIHEAIQLVYNNQMDNSSAAYSVAMGLCLEPRTHSAPLDGSYVTSPRTYKESY